MIDWVELFIGIPSQIATILIAMIPIGELRGALPIALGPYSLPLWQAYPLAVLGNMIPVFFILWLFGPVSEWLRQWKIFNRFFDWLFERTRKKFYDKHKKWGDLALVLFVAIPLPVTGAWTGSLAAWLFGIPKKKALPLIFSGVLIAGVIVSAISLGALKIFF
ncbi:MAG: small multi-drug export protein [bacterium]|nr:small multi-drug export protein [bacterium]